MQKREKLQSNGLRVDRTFNEDVLPDKKLMEYCEDNGAWINADSNGTVASIWKINWKTNYSVNELMNILISQ